MPRISDDVFMDGMKPFFYGAAVLFFFGILVMLLQLQSASFVQWDGIKVRGDTYEGVTSYTYNGVSYTIANRDVSANDKRHIPTTVWLSRWHPDDEGQAYIESWTDRWTDFVFTTVWFFGVALILVIGMVRLRRRRRRNMTVPLDNFGAGLDPEFVQRRLDERRRPPERRTR